MNVKLWQIAAFILVVVAGTWWSFPYQRDLAGLYMDSGNIVEARRILQKTLAESTPDFATLVEAAKLHNLLGEAQESIDLMERALALKPRNMNALRTLADYYTWDLDLAQAAALRERMVAIQPTADAWESLLGYYRYTGENDRATNAVAHLAPLRFKDGVKTLSPLSQALSVDLKRLSQRFLEHGEDAQADYLLRRLFAFYEQYESLLANSPEAVNRLQYATWVQEIFVGTDRLDQGREFADRLDRITHGYDGRLALATVLRWNAMTAEALPVIKELQHQFPDQEPLLRELALTGRQAGDMGSAAMALEALTKRHPESLPYRRELADVYLADQQFGRAVELLRDLIRRGGDAAATVRNMLRAALYSDDKTTMAEALDESNRYDLSDPEVLRARAEVHLALDQPDKAYAVLEALVDSQAGTPEDLSRMLDAAGASPDPKILAQALDLATRKRPGDATILRSAAQATAGAGNAARAYALMDRIPTGQRTRDDYLAMLDYAGGSAQAKLVRRATGQAVAAYPKDLGVVDQAATVASWVLPPAETYPLARRAARLSGGDKARVDRMIQLASFADNPPLLVGAVKEARKLRPKDQDYIFAEADALAAAGEGTQLSALVARYATSGDPAKLRKWADYAEASGNNEQAFQLFKALHDKLPDNTAVRDGLLRNAEYAGHYDVAAGILAGMSDKAPTNFELAKRAGQDYAAAGLSDQALVYLERATNLKPDDQEVRLALLEAQAFGGDPAKAVEYYEQAAGQRQLTDDEQLNLAEGYAALNRNRDALALVQKYRDVSPLPERAGLLLARMYAATDQPRRAESVLKRLLAQAGNNAETLRQVGSEALYAGAYDLAARAFRELARIAPNDATALKGLAIVYGDQGEYERGISQFRNYLKLFPGDADARYRLAEFYLAANKPRLAASEFEQARKLLNAQKRATQAGNK